MRANLFVYCAHDDSWLGALRQTPEAALQAAMTGLGKLIGAFKVSNNIKIRPTSLVATVGGYRQPGVVLIGDAFATSCPAAGTGLNKVFTDAARLCATHIPRWLASEGMAEDKIGAFYDDAVKIACDAHLTLSARYGKSLCIDTTLPWRLRRWRESLHARIALSARVRTS